MLLLPLPGAAGETSRFDASIGYQNWTDAGDLETDFGGSFDSGGFALEFSYHTTFNTNKPTGLLWGFTMGLMGHDSNISGLNAGEDLDLTGYYLNPSLKWILQNTADRAVFLDLGVGYYHISIDEYSSECYWDCYAWEYYDDNSFGGFVGLRADFVIGRWNRMNLTTGIKAHFVDFGSPAEINSQSELGGTIWQVYVGVATSGF